MAVDRQSIRILEEGLRRAGLPVRFDEPLSQYTSYRVGGPADLFVTVHQVSELELAVKNAIAAQVPYLVIGGGTNLLCSDRGYRGLAIRNCCTGICIGEVEWPAGKAIVRVEAGVRMRTLARKMAEAGLGDLSWAYGIPGTVGGAIVGNAGAFGGSIADVLTAVEWLDGQGVRGSWGVTELQFGYRQSRLKGRHDMVILAASLQLSARDENEQLGLMEDYTERRRQAQPTGPSAGSIFRNPPNDFAGRLIEAAGLKGRRIGGAHVSQKHANFIINDRNASASDIYALIREVQEEVAKQFGVRLELEIELVGEF